MYKMTKVDENIQTAQNLLSWIVERCYMLEEENKKLKKENRKLENKILKLWTRIYQNIIGEKRKEYQEYCKRHKL